MQGKNKTKSTIRSIVSEIAHDLGIDKKLVRQVLLLTFRRACVKWGIGRFLYRLPIQTLTTKQWKGKDYPYAPEKDKIIFDGDTLTKYINWKIKNNK